MVHRVQPDVGMGRSAAPCPMSLTAFPSYDLHSINFTCLKCVNFGSVNFGKYAQSCASTSIVKVWNASSTPVSLVPLCR